MGSDQTNSISTSKSREGATSQNELQFWHVSHIRVSAHLDKMLVRSVHSRQISFRWADIIFKTYLGHKKEQRPHILQFSQSFVQRAILYFIILTQLVAIKRAFAKGTLWHNISCCVLLRAVSLLRQCI